ncbi:DUF6177 family protein [Arthrobacter sp. 31Y]|uniref:DUF6177 family protein n=1 Tax=Arthrobacter sp. 31Y TaxID=1115632 RepID=UPI0004646F4A|nr:DUF6177 family protein [Arthrobacter sp. 31Y]
MSSIPLVPVPTPAGRPWLSRTLRGDLQQAAAASAGNGIVALQTQADAAVSYPLLAFLKAARIPWVVEGSDGEARDALMAAEDSAATEAFAATEALTAAGAPEVSPAVVMYGSVLHAASGDLMLGAFTSAMLAAAGCTPEYMGPVEPLHEPWDPAVLTAGLREDMPLGIWLLSGQGFAGVVTAYRAEAGVVEAFDVMTMAPGIDALADPAALEAAVRANAQEFGAELHVGASGLSVGVGQDFLRVPQLLVLGPSLRRIVPESLMEEPTGMTAQDLGYAPFQHLAIRYPAASTWDGGIARATQQRILGAA